jgi:tryptophanyl-tRNA synthetase
VVALLAPIQERYAALEGDRERLDAILAAGAAAAGRRAARTVSKVRRKVGLVEPARG